MRPKPRYLIDYDNNGYAEFVYISDARLCAKALSQKHSTVLLRSIRTERLLFSYTRGVEHMHED